MFPGSPGAHSTRMNGGIDEIQKIAPSHTKRGCENLCSLHTREHAHVRANVSLTICPPPQCTPFKYLCCCQVKVWKACRKGECGAAAATRALSLWTVCARQRG
jgi:hypothetical protein